MMLWFGLYNLLLAYVLTERELPDYTKDEGMAPSWINNNDHSKAIVDRWYVDKADAICKPFKYLGSLGNFNNFVSKDACLNHLKFTQEEKADACKTDHSIGKCDLSGTKALTRWYFKIAAVGDKTNSCHKFKYSGCGGNANNFDSEEECNNVCRNKENGGITENLSEDKLTAIPNEFDCTFIPEVKTMAPKMGIVPHKDGNRCFYAAIGQFAKRGFFKDLPTCVKTCVSIVFCSKTLIEYLIEKQAPACSLNVPYQTPSTETPTNGAKVFYYFKQSESVCLPFMSKPPEGTNITDDGTLNIFSSPELCASYCPAIKNAGKIKATQPCTEKVAGVKQSGDTYTIKRFYYDSAKNAGTNNCKLFDFNGKEMNLNNFESSAACDGICKNPLSAGD